MTINSLCKNFIQSLVCLFFSTYAIASIERALPLTTWDGVYLGLETGGGWQKANWKYKNNNFFNTLGPVLLGRDFDFTSSNLTGGGFAGVNYSIRQFVIGAELSAIYVGFDTFNAGPFFPDSEKYRSTLNWLYTAKGRLGLPYDRFLIYFAGGWAYGTVSISLNDFADGVRSRSSIGTDGWDAGAGIDYKINNHLAFGVAYDYIRLSIHNRTLSCPHCGTGVGLGTPKVNSDLNNQLAVLRLSYFV